ncbi:hypothetical protein [Microbacterium sp. P02]|uniref:hypothetical protein n=1 Tax=unclassified Microbacterium TaxID=2609290 RepID=UPI00366D241E
MRRTIAGLTIALCAVLGLTACTGSTSGASPTSSGAPAAVDQTGDEGQSVTDACALIQDTIADASAEFESVAAQDPAAVVESMNAAASKLADAAPSITNDEVAGVVAPLQEMFAKTAEVMAAVAKGDVTKLGDLSDLGTQFQETGEKFQALCAP